VSNMRGGVTDVHIKPFTARSASFTAFRPGEVALVWIDVAEVAGTPAIAEFEIYEGAEAPDEDKKDAAGDLVNLRKHIHVAASGHAMVGMAPDGATAIPFLGGVRVKRIAGTANLIFGFVRAGIRAPAG